MSDDRIVYRCPNPKCDRLHIQMCRVDGSTVTFLLDEDSALLLATEILAISRAIN